ncbi:MAG: 4Fe-4S binding protein, partial [Clostridia bacterium]|nr:4Fe-4S binding protein [Clostridia bacterium]
MSITICKSELCSGCSLCADVCVRGAVTMERDKAGFYRPSVNDSLCVGCGACQASCPVNAERKAESLAVYAAYSKDDNIRRRSSSGGIFRLLAEKVIEDGGAVAAVGFGDDLSAVYKIAQRREDLDELMGSKYTEAHADGIYKKVADII